MSSPHVRRTAPDRPAIATLPVDADDVRRVARWLRQHEDDVVADVFSFVSVETPSDDKARLNDGLTWIQSWVDRRLPHYDARELFDGGLNGDVLQLVYAGTGKGTGPVITFLSHYDTVWDAGTITDWPAERDGNRATGPGIYDMKTGLVQSLWTMLAMVELDIPRPTVRMLFTGDEEIGSPFAREHIESASRDSAAVIVFEASERAAIKTERKGIGRFNVSVAGRESHAGADYTAGVSAIDELARVILHLHGLTDLTAGTTVNVGVIQGGTRSNVIAGSADAQVDVRFTKNSEIDRISAVLESLRPFAEDAVIAVTGGWNRPAMERSPLTTDMFELARRAAQAIEVELGEISVGGGSDGNFAAALGVPVLDGMGAVGAGPHARSEHVFLNKIAERAAISAGVVGAFAKELTT